MHREIQADPGVRADQEDRGDLEDRADPEGHPRLLPKHQRQQHQVSADNIST